MNRTKNIKIINSANIICIKIVNCINFTTPIPLPIFNSEILPPNVSTKWCHFSTFKNPLACLFICLYVHSYMCMYVHSSVCRFIYTSTCSFPCLSVHALVFAFIRLSVHALVFAFIHLSVHLSVSSFTRLPIHPSFTSMHMSLC